MAIKTVIDPSNKVPGTYIEVLFGVGPRSSGSSPKIITLTGNMMSTGTMLVEQEYEVFGFDDAALLAGYRSELSLMARAAVDAYPGARLRIIAIAESAGANATRTIVFTGTATKAGTVYVRCLGEVVQVPYAVGDTPTVIAARVATYATNKAYWPVTCTASTGTLTVTAAQKGPRGNFIRFSVDIDSATGTTVPAVSTDYLTGGTTSDTPQNVLDVMAAARRAYLVAPYSDSTNLTLYRTHLDAQDEPTIGHRKQCTFGSIDTVGNTTTLVTAMNFPRMACGWLRNSDYPPSMLAAALAAVRAQKEAIKASQNMDNLTLTGVPTQAFTSWEASSGELTSATDNGITALVRNGSGTVGILRSITTKSQDSAGRPDYRVLDTSKVTVADEFADQVELYFSDFTNWNADNDPADGSAPPPETMTPALAKQGIINVSLDMERAGNFAAGKTMELVDQIQVELSTVSAGRFNCIVPFDVVEGFHQTSASLRQVG